MLYSGIDLHKDNCYITTVNETGAIVNQTRLPNDDLMILDYFFSKGKTHKAVVESTSSWYWISDLLNDHGIEFVLAHAKYLKAISYAKVKTDKVDSLTLAQLLRMKFIPMAHQISPEVRGQRDLMRARLRLVSKRTSCFNSIHRILEKFNIAVPNNKPLAYPTTLKLLTELPLSLEYQYQVNCHCEQIALLNRQIKNLEKSLHPFLIPNDDIQRLLTIPGIGKILAFTTYLEVDSIERFPLEKKFLSYCRLVPGASNSNQKQKHKSGNKEGNVYLKLAFTEMAVKAMQNYKEIKRFYNTKTRKKPKSIAKTLVAKELARITYHVLKEKTEFKTFKGIALSKQKSRRWPRLTSPGTTLDQ